MSNEPGIQALQGRYVSLRDIDSHATVRAHNETRAVLLAANVRLALHPWRRLLGLLSGPALQPGEALLLRPCKSVHTCMMRYPIDVVFLDPDGLVVGLRPRLAPWRISSVCWSALCTLELPVGVIDSSGTAMGDRIAFEVVR